MDSFAPVVPIPPNGPATKAKLGVGLVVTRVVSKLVTDYIKERNTTEASWGRPERDGTWCDCPFSIVRTYAQPADKKRMGNGRIFPLVEDAGVAIPKGALCVNVSWAKPDVCCCTKQNRKQHSDIHTTKIYCNGCSMRRMTMSSWEALDDACIIEIINNVTLLLEKAF